MIRVKKYGTAVLIWMLQIPIAILNGGLREYVLVNLGVIAQPLSGIILSACIFAAAFFLLPKIRSCSKFDYFLIGILWFILTNIFDLVMYIKDGGGFSDLLQSYDISTGNTWMIVVLTALLSPLIVMKIRSRSRAAG